MMESEFLQCYNRGCGKKYYAQENSEGSCVYHPGAPFFHDAYKGWSCCKKKCTDFTEFLNIKGCTVSKHSNVKPVEPERPKVDQSKADEVVVVEAPRTKIEPPMKRPSFDFPLVSLNVTMTPSLKAELAKEPADCNNSNNSLVDVEASQVKVGTSCKNHGCTKTYIDESSNTESCVYHPGVPIFHEGLKFWSCCQRRTTDFNAFLDQKGCKTNIHCWEKQEDKEDKQQGRVKCRYDWHQTGTHVVITVYAKNYLPKKSKVEANPVRLKSFLGFPNGSFLLDMELSGIINVDKSSVTMAATKVEIKLKKAEPGSWSKLDIPRPTPTTQDTNLRTDKSEALVSKVDAVDLSDL